MLPSARKGEECLCPAHGLGVVDKSAAGSVETNGRGQARGGDATQCTGGPIDFLVTGSGSVTVNSQPAARMSDKTMHRGLVVLGSGDVVIGGPTVGATLGNKKAGTACCESMAAGRDPASETGITPGARKQSYSNCGIESSRQIINTATGKKLTEGELLRKAVDRGQAFGTTDPKLIRYAGGSLPEQRVALLNENGVPAEAVPGTVDNMVQASAEGRGVEVDIWAGTIWPPSYGRKPGTGPHSVLVTGIEFDANGLPTGVIINDTGAGDCGKTYPIETFRKAIIGQNHVITKQPIW